MSKLGTGMSLTFFSGGLPVVKIYCYGASKLHLETSKLSDESSRFLLEQVKCLGGLTLPRNK